MQSILTKLILFCSLLSSTTTACAGTLEGPLLKDTQGTGHRITEYIGKDKWVILNVWGTDCPPCQEEVPELVRFHDEHEASDAIVVGIAIDFPSFGYADKTDVINFMDDYFIDFPVFLSDASITEKLGLGRLEGLPTTYVFDPKGKLLAVQVGGVTKQLIEKFIDRMKLKKPGS